MASSSGNPAPRKPVVDPTEILWDGDVVASEPASSDSLATTGETPAEPLPLTIEYIPGAKSSLSTATDDGPLLSLQDATLPGSSVDGHLVGPASDPAIRYSVPGYEILRELGRGGMGVVYQALQKGLNRMVALKMILSGAHAGPAERDRFRREAEAVAQLQHPNIVQIFDVGEADGRPYLAFEYVEGGSLASFLAGQPWSVRQAAELVETLARAVHFAHERGIVHRDLKPGNVLMGIAPSSAERISGGKGRNNALPLPTSAKVTDFGLAKRFEPDSDGVVTGEFSPGEAAHATRTGAVMGTPSYIAPEQAAGKNKDVGPSADIYSLGAILYELLTGRPPFRGETALDTVLQVMTEDPVPPRRLQPKIPRDLETICLKCLQKSPVKRYLTAEELADDLRHHLRHEPIAARPIGYWERGVKMAKRHPAAATLALTSMLAVITLLAVSISFNFRLREAADAKENEARIAREERENADVARAEALFQANIAKERAKEANERAIQAKDAEKKAKEANELASKRLEISRRGEYALTLNQVMALAERDPQGASRLLLNSDRCPPRLRDFTWQMLRRMYLVEEEQVRGHGNVIAYITYSPDGNYIASASWDGTVRILDLQTLHPLAILRGHRGVVRAVAFAPDSRTLVTTGNDGTLRLWEIPPTLSHAFRGDAPVPILRPWALLLREREAFRTAIFSGDGKYLIAGTVGGMIHVWDLPRYPRLAFASLAGGAMMLTAHIPDGGYTREFGPAMPLPAKFGQPRSRKRHRGEVSAIVWSKDGLITASTDRTIRLGSIESLTDERLLLEHNQPIYALAYSPQDALLAIVGNSGDEPSIRLWNMAQQKDAGLLRGHTRTVTSVAFHPEGKLLASAGYDGTVRIWETASGQERCLLRGNTAGVRSVAFRGGRWGIASGGDAGVVRLWSLAGQREETMELGGNVPLRGVAITPDNRWMAEVDNLSNLKIWHLHTSPQGRTERELAYTLRGKIGPNVVLTISPDGGTVAVASIDADEWVVRIWNLQGFIAGQRVVDVKESRTFKAPGRIQSLAIHGKLLAVAGMGGLQIWDLISKQLIHQPIDKLGDRQTLSIAFSPKGERLFSAVGNLVQVWDVGTATQLAAISTALVHSKSRDGIQLVALGPTIESEDKTRKGMLTLVTVDEMGFAVLWDFDPHAIVGKRGREDLQPEAAVLKQRCSLSGHMESITSISFTPDGKTLATSGQDRTVRLWDPIAGQERATLTGHTDAVYLCHFRSDGRTLLTVGREGQMRVWHAE